jgi:calcineurin-like phosphoesterase family protein
MTDFFTADLHLNHFNIMKYCGRPFHALKQMNNALVENWNKVISKDDTVYLLGDFCFEGKKSEVLKWKAKLNGHIILVRGNHDHKITRKAFKPDCHDELEMQIGIFKCVLAHRPLYPEYYNIPERDRTAQVERELQYEKYDFVISGHVHNLRLWTGKSLNVGVDMHNFTPLSYDDVLALLEKQYAKNQAA